MREGKFRLQFGALVLGAGLALGVAAPAFAQEVPGASVDDDESVIETDELVITADDPSTIEEVDDTPQDELFTDAFLDCSGDFGISECTEEVLIDLGLEEEDDLVVVDNTPLNPVDEGSIEVIDLVEIDEAPPGT